MTFYIVRKVKLFQNEKTGIWNISCEFCDGFMFERCGNDEWHTNTTGFYQKGFHTKQELEYALFKDIVDGKLTGVKGKFACIDMWNRTVKLTEDETAELKHLEERKNRALNCKALSKRLRQAGIPYEKWQDSPEYSRKQKIIADAKIAYDSYKYSVYYRAWQEYLSTKHSEKETKHYYVISLVTENENNMREQYFISEEEENDFCLSTSYKEAKIYHATQVQIKKYILKSIRRNEISEFSITDVTEFVKIKDGNPVLTRKPDFSKNIFHQIVTVS